MAEARNWETLRQRSKISSFVHIIDPATFLLKKNLESSRQRVVSLNDRNTNF